MDPTAAFWILRPAKRELDVSLADVERAVRGYGDGERSLSTASWTRF